MQRISIIGAGLMGHGIAQVFAIHGHPVTLMDINDGAITQAMERIRANLNFMVSHGIGTLDDIEPATERIQYTSDLEKATHDADLVIEAILEKLDLKQKLFHDLDAQCRRDTILATNTSVISISEIAKAAVHQDRIVGTHFWNPPYLIPLVEVIRGKETSDESMEKTFNVLKSVGKHPVRVQRDVPGFVGNRLQHALWREALSIVEHGIADAATVDECIKFGFGIRLPVLGPLENVDMVGTDLTLDIHNYILRHLESSPEPSMLLIDKVMRHELGFKTGKGYQEWTSEQVKQSRERLLEYLIEVIKSK